MRLFAGGRLFNFRDMHFLATNFPGELPSSYLKVVCAPGQS